MGTATDAFRGPLAALWGDAASVRALERTLRGGLPVPPADDRAVWDAVDDPTLAALRAVAQTEAGTPWPVTTATTFARLHRDGDRDEHEQRVFARQHRLSRAVVLAAAGAGGADGDRLLDEVADGVLLLCEQSSWCWPAHDRFVAARGTVLPDAAAPFLDLGAGEVAGRLAWTDHLLGTALDARWPGLRARIRHEVDARVLRPFEDVPDWHWLGLDGDVHNWNPWIHGNVLAAALALVDDAGRRAALVARVVEGLDRYVASLPADGAIDEGYAYWWNGALRGLEALDLLRTATGGALDASGVGALAQVVAFPHRMHLGGPWYLNVADGQARPPVAQPWAALHRAGRAFGDADAVAHAAAHRVAGTPVGDVDYGLGFVVRALTDAAWVGAVPAAPRGATSTAGAGRAVGAERAAGADPDRPAPDGSPLPRDVWLPSVQVLLARGAAGTARGLTLAAKGGHDDEHHNHNDVGSFVVALGGVPVLVDAGRPTYTRQTFSPDRYAIWTMQSAWHNVPEVAGVQQPASRTAAARDVVAVVDDTGSALSTDLADAYPGAGLASWRRTARLDRGSGTVEVRDAWTWAGPPPTGGRGSTCVRVLLAGDITRDGDDAVLVRALDGAGTVRVRWTGDVVGTTLERRDLDDPMLADVWGAHLTRLTLELADGAPTGGTVTTTVEEVG